MKSRAMEANLTTRCELAAAATVLARDCDASPRHTITAAQHVQCAAAVPGRGPLATRDRSALQRLWKAAPTKALVTSTCGRAGRRRHLVQI